MRLVDVCALELSVEGAESELLRRISAVWRIGWAGGRMLVFLASLGPLKQRNGAAIM